MSDQHEHHHHHHHHHHEEEDEKRLPFVEHLRELRTRTIRAVLYVVVGFGIGWAFHEPVFQWLTAPYNAAIAGLETTTGIALAYRSVTEPIVVYLKTALIAGTLLALPLVFLEVWLFVAPGLYKSERRLAFPFLIATLICFGGGVLFCRYLAFEPALYALLRFSGEGTTASIMMGEYFSFTTRLLVVFGVLFELPVAVSFLSMIGVVRPSLLIRNWRYALVIAFVVGAIFTPPDPLTQIALAVPLSILYGVSILLSWLIWRGKESETPDDALEEGS